VNQHPFNRDERLSIQQRENWLEQQIRDSQERGEFDNLSGSGKPQEFIENPHGADWESGFRVLKNAGVAPFWIEVDKAIRTLHERMAALIERTNAFILDHSATDAPAPPAQTQPTGWRGRLSRLWDTGRASRERSAPTTWDLETFRQRARREYLDMAAELDRNIAEFNNSLPEGLWWKERQRLPLDQAASNFDTAVPPRSS
jgi:hypothetical protein